jgi:hypothetical protein
MFFQQCFKLHNQKIKSIPIQINPSPKNLHSPPLLALHNPELLLFLSLFTSPPWMLAPWRQDGGRGGGEAAAAAAPCRCC